MRPVLNEMENLHRPKRANRPAAAKDSREGLYRAVPVIVVPVVTTSGDSDESNSSLDASPNPAGASLYSLVRSRLSSHQVEAAGPQAEQLDSYDKDQRRKQSDKPMGSALACPCLGVQLSQLKTLADSEATLISNLLTSLTSETPSSSAVDQDDDEDIAERLRRLLLSEKRRQHALQLISATSAAMEGDADSLSAKSLSATSPSASFRPLAYQLRVSQIILPIQPDRLVEHQRHCFVCLLLSPIGCVYASKMADSSQIDHSESSNSLSVPCAISVPCLAADFEVNLQIYWLRLGNDAPLAAGGCSYRVPNKRRRFFPRLGVKSLLSNDQQQQQQKQPDQQLKFALLGEVAITMELVRRSAGCVSIEAPPIGSCPVSGFISLRCGVQTDPSARSR